MKFMDASGTEIFSIPDAYSADSEDLTTYYKETEHEKVDGGVVVIIEATASKYRNRFTFSGLPKTYRDAIFTLKNLHTSFLFQPHSDAAEQYTCNLINPQFNMTNFWTSPTGERCYSGSFEVKET